MLLLYPLLPWAAGISDAAPAAVPCAGIVFEERREGGIFIAELPEEGKAARTGLAEVGDELLATSAVVYTGQDTYGGVTVRKGMEVVRIPVRGESFNAVRPHTRPHGSSCVL